MANGEVKDIAERAAQRTASKGTTKKKVVRPKELEEKYEPLELSSAQRDEETEEEKVHLFTIDGTKYYMPAHIGANVSLRFIRLVRQEGEMYAVGEMLERILGEDGYTALMEYDGLTDEHLQQVMNMVMQRLQGKMEALAGN